MKKNNPGYIRRYRRINLIWLIVWVIIGVAIFTTGWLIWHTRANILTVMAVLSVLPGAKRIVALIAAGRKKSVSLDRCRKLETEVEPFIYAGDLDLHEYEPDIDAEAEVEADSSAEAEVSSRKSPYEEPEIPWNVIFTDYIFTSTEKIMMLDFMVVTGGTIFILPSSINKDQDYVKKYLTDGIKKWSTVFDIKFVWDDEKLLAGLKNLQESKVVSRERREVLEYLKSLAV